VIRSCTLLILTFLLVANGILSGQTSSAAHSDKLGMRQHYDAAYRFQSSGDFARADVEHKHFLAAALDHLANFYANTGDYLHAAPYYDEAIKLTPNDFALLMDYAGASLDAHNSPKAKTLLQTVMELDATSMTASQKADIHLMYGRTLRALGDTKAAIEQFHTAIALDPSIDDYGFLADAMLELDDLSSASHIFTGMVTQFGDSAAVHMRIGRIYALAGFPDRAVDEFKRAVALDYKMPDVHYCLGAAYMSNRASDLPLAEAEFRKEVALHPDDTFSYPQLGYIALRHLDYHAAELEFRHAIALNPLNADVFADLGKLYTETGRLSEAVDAFRKAIALTSDPARSDYAIERVHYQLGRLLIARGDDAEGQRELQIAQELLSQRDKQAELKMTGKPAERNPLERTRVATPKEVEELELFAKQIRPLLAGSYNNLGVHAAMGEKYAEAAGYFQLAAKWDSTLAGVYPNWGRAAYAAHDCIQAIDPLHRAVAADSSNTELAAMLKQCQDLQPVATEGDMKK
jgi:tetratricopeptide (TPR) repeat protein